MPKSNETLQPSVKLHPSASWCADFFQIRWLIRVCLDWVVDLNGRWWTWICNVVCDTNKLVPCDLVKPLYCLKICSLVVGCYFFFTQYGMSWSRCWLKDLVSPHHSSFSHALNSAGLFSQKRRRVINRAWAHNRVSQPSWEVSQITICSTSALSPPQQPVNGEQ